MAKPTPDPLKFKAKLTGRGPGGAWTFIEIPSKISEAFGSKGQVPARHRQRSHLPQLANPARRCAHPRRR